ncbi:MAG: DUF5916 domain-containing protein [Acidobacteriota bacterium]
MTPYILAGAQNDYAAGGGTERVLEPGIDIKYSLTSNLTLDGTVNTDFAQVEVDEEQINLTRFDLFFPEKRPFFLENAGTFQLGTPEQAELFFSRRIGIDKSGAQIPIVAGLRLTGKIGRTNLGLLDMQTERVDRIAPANNFFVGRVSHEFMKRSSAGLLFVNREATSSGPGTERNRTFGADLNLGVTDNWTIFTYLAKTETPGLGGRDLAGRLLADYNSPLWQTRAGYTEVGENFNPEVGFLRRSGYRKPEFRLQFSPQVEKGWVRQYEPHMSLERYYDRDGSLESEFQHYDYRMELSNGSRLGIAYNRYFELLRNPFEIASSLFIPSGRYGWNQVSANFASDRSANVFFDGDYTQGGFYAGDIRTAGAEAGFQTGGKFLATVRFSNNDVDLPTAHFSTRLARVKLNYSFTTHSFVQGLLQYNSQTRQFSSNVRFALINTSGTGLFIVYNERYDSSSDLGRGPLGLSPLNRALFVKYTHLFDF